MEKSTIVKIHPRSFSKEDLIINLDFFGKPRLQAGDLVQICIQDDESKSLYLQVKDLPLEIQPKGGTITLGTTAAQVLGISGMTNAIVRKVNIEDVTIGLTELRIKNQYIGQSDMWRLTNSLMDACVYVGKTIEFAGIRVQVDKLWRHGENVSSGAVAADSRVVFRSASAQMFVFIQVCAEITDFDSHGDQYFDKAMNGFMIDLFKKLKESECNHLATIVLFSRTYYYKAKHTDDFPTNMRGSVLKDCKGRFYEDFYNVIGEIHTESETEWARMIIKTKKSFMQHLSKANCCQEDSSVPVGTISKSFQGNFLEVINLTLNALSTNQVDLNLTMTGQSIIIVTPGVGVFEVDRKLYALTNSRVSDLCVGVDVICLTEQPFHAIPLLMFQTKSTTSSVNEDFTTPDWMNYSFYNPQSVWSRGQFEPRIKLSDHLINKFLHNQAPPTPLITTPQSLYIRSGRRGSKASITDQRLLQRTDYDEYDEQIFRRRILVQHSISGVQRDLHRHKSDEELRIDFSRFDEQPLSDDDNTFSTDSNSDVSLKLPSGKVGQAVELSMFAGSLDNSGETTRGRFLSTGSNLQSSMILTDQYKDRSVAGTASNVGVSHTLYYSPQHSRRATERRRPIVNPFVPQRVHQNVTANKRKWMHVFPRNRVGHAFQPHHDVSAVSLDNSARSTSNLESDVWNAISDSNSSNLSDKKLHTSRLFGKVRSSEGGCQPSIAENFAMTRRMGTDWESVIKPACLPVTTDYFPSQKELEQKFSEYNYNLSYESSTDIAEMSDNHLWSSPRKCMGPIEALKEVISQRISLGFQLVLDDRYPDLYHLHNELTCFSKTTPTEDANFKVSLGRVHHRIVLSYPDIKIVMYNPAEKYKHNLNHLIGCHDYCYRLCPSGQETFQPRESVLKHEGTENFNWNYVDQHVLGYQDFAELPESTRYQKFRCRYLLLPTEQMLAGKQDPTCSQLVEGFVKLLDFLNHIKRRQHPKQSTASSTPSRSSSTPSRSSSTPSRSSSRVGTPARMHSPNAPHVSQPVDIGNRRTSTPHIGSYSIGKETSVLSPDNRTRHASKSLHQNVNVADLLKPNRHHRRKSETDFVEKERRKSDTDYSQTEKTGNLVLSLDQGGSLEELTEASSTELSSTELSNSITEKQDKELKADIAGIGNSNKINKQQIKRHSSMTMVTTPGITKTPPTPQRKTMRQYQSLDMGDHPVESVSGSTLSLCSPVKAMPFNTSSSPADIIDGSKNQETGLEFVTSHVAGLHCFVAMDMVKWLLDNVDGLENRKHAVRFAQGMVEKRLIGHASGDFNVSFKDGYHLFKIVMSNGSSDDKTYCVIDGKGDEFKTHWFEVAILQPSMLESRIDSSTATPSSMSSTSSPQNDSLPYYLKDYCLQEEHFAAGKSFSTENQFVELNPDTQKLSDRPEWCFVHYDSTYHPSRTYQLEFQWVVSTAALLSQLVQSWSRKAHMCGFNLVRVPLFNNLNSDEGSYAHPFRNPQCIPLHMPNEYSTVAKLKNFVQAITERFRFLPDLDRDDSSPLSPSYQNGVMFYVHYSGNALIKPQWQKCHYSEDTKDAFGTDVSSFNSLTDVVADDDDVNNWTVCGFWWYSNHFADIPSSSPNELLNSFQAFCQDQDKQLQKFCSQFVH